jgi:FkbM family methyltransferase
MLSSLWRRLRGRSISLPPGPSYALDELDLKLARHLDVEGGFFVEAGANDGITQSNTLHFERYHGWRGLLVEPIPELAKRCRKHRPGCIVENAALVPPDFDGDRIEMTYCNLMSQVKGAMKTRAEEADHLRRGSECQKLETYALSVPACTLSSLLDRHGIAHVDLLSLDVEGFELAALRGLDLARHAPTWMLIEARYRHDIDALLAPRYDIVAELSHHDVLYRRKAADAALPQTAAA